jgi:hypothetical protein
MANVKHGSLSLEVADHVAPHEQAKKLSPEDVQAIPKAPRDIGGICEETADLLEASPDALPLPAHITPKALRLAASQADDTDTVISELEYMLSLFKRSNLLYDAAAWKMLREVNDAIQSRGKHEPDVLKLFAPVLRYFKRRFDPIRAFDTRSE